MLLPTPRGNAMRVSTSSRRIRRMVRAAQNAITTETRKSSTLPRLMDTSPTVRV
ncbi:hypothetical protein D9M68_908430 [compost metagenome]